MSSVLHYCPHSFRPSSSRAIEALIREYPLACIVIHTSSFLSLPPNSNNETTNVIREPFVANHIPLLYDAETKLFRGHIARANPLTRLLKQHHAAARSKSSNGEKKNVGVQCFLSFRGPDAYVSPSAYPSKKQHEKVVPTWNYSMVAVQGEIELIDNAEWVERVVSDLTDQNEILAVQQRQASSGQSSRAWKLSDAPRSYVESNLKAIVGISIRPIGKMVSSLDGGSCPEGNKQEEENDTKVVANLMRGKWKVSQNKTAEDKNGVSEDMKNRGFDAMSRLVDSPDASSSAAAVGNRSEKKGKEETRSPLPLAVLCCAIGIAVGFVVGSRS